MFSQLFTRAANDTIHNTGAFQVKGPLGISMAGAMFDRQDGHSYIQDYGKGTAGFSRRTESEALLDKF
ncbi:MAG: hypothetical protein C4576_31235 [Desulfobacteraceae bacterium]|nr:MAG: hypothetical protein C4576_31235 [Desulfobacteraceae bacterium]